MASWSIRVKNTFLDFDELRGGEECSSPPAAKRRSRSLSDTTLRYSCSRSGGEVATCCLLRSPRDDEEATSQGSCCAAPSECTNGSEDWCSAHADNEVYSPSASDAGQGDGFQDLATAMADEPCSHWSGVVPPASHEVGGAPQCFYLLVPVWPPDAVWTERSPPATKAAPPAEWAEEEAAAAPAKEAQKRRIVEDDEAAAKRYTTLMLRGLPCNYDNEMLGRLLRAHGVEYTFSYFPADFRRMCGLGYAFVVCESHEGALEAKASLDGFSGWEVEGSKKVCSVCWGAAEFQGLEANIERYRNSPVMHESVPERFKPTLYEQGLRVPFPGPTKRLPKPRCKHGRGTRTPADA
mmetsp:Transcript_94599/g.282534  ORF Transcript_94599/g.282534 Transcript_94599/m.282534 type:complete len:351 (-) Transcript_94599:17-1069(-)